MLRDLLSSLVRSGHLVHAAPDIYFARAAFDDATSRVRAYIDQHGSISTAEAKAMLGLSRKFLIPLLEALDKARITVRSGEQRKLRRPVMSG